MIYLLKIIVCLNFLLLAGCNRPVEDVQEAYANFYTVLNSSVDKSELAAKRKELENSMSALSPTSSDLADFERLKFLYDLRLQTFTGEDPKSLQQYVYISLAEENLKDLTKYQVKAPSCYIFNPKNKLHSDGLKSVYENLKKGSFEHKGSAYSYLEFINRWKALKNLDEAGALKALTAALQKGLCFGASEVVNNIFCQNPNISDDELFSLSEANIQEMLKEQILSEITSDLEKNISDSFTRVLIERGLTKINPQSIGRGYLLSREIKNILHAVLANTQRDYGAMALFLSGKTGHRLSLHISKGRYRIIDNNVGILFFNDEDSFLAAVIKIITFNYIDNLKPAFWLRKSC